MQIKESKTTLAIAGVAVSTAERVLRRAEHCRTVDEQPGIGGLRLKLSEGFCRRTYCRPVPGAPSTNPPQTESSRPTVDLLLLRAP
uniref:Uncharacterized protein n=1 Tax=Anopheles aquasalis TaxID=42839 RepID=T1DQ64_ANOAQ